MAPLPMFPLGTVLLPGSVLPLHVFELRYRALVHDCLAGTPEFGVALIERGHEVGGGDRRFDVGCVARILESEETPDGRWGLVTVGVRRVRVVRWLDDDPYPRAELEEWPDDEPPASCSPRCESLAAELRRVLALASELGASVPSATGVEVSDDATKASYQLASLLPVGPLDKLALLAASSVGARLDLLASLLADTEAVLVSRLGGG
jgi:Lon protease-like protein